MSREDDYPLGEDMPRIIDDDVESMSARIAAATVRMDYGFIEDVIQDAKARWQEEGRKAQVESDRRKADYDMVWHRKRRYWFQTLDGLLGEHEIDAQMERHEMIVLAARHPMEICLNEKPMAKAESIPVRRYLFEGRRHRDGRPIFEEQP